MAYQEIVAELQRKVARVSGTGIVHDYRRYARTKEDLLTQFGDPDNGKDKVRGWMISRISIGDIQAANVANTIVHTFLLRGYLSFLDNQRSDIEFQQMIDNIRSEFTPQDNLGSNCELTRPIQVDTIELTSYGGFLVHYCDATIEVQEYVTS